MIYRFHPAAEAEHLETVALYELRRAGLGASYLSELEQVMAQVLAAPRRYRIERKPDIRRASLTRFPFTVVFRERPGAIEVLAVAHKRRRPGYWAGRL